MTTPRSRHDARTLAACRDLQGRCSVLASILEEAGPPRWRSRPGGYPGLARIIIEQQLSVASANAILLRCEAATGGLSPHGVLAREDADLRALGLSRPKIRYLKALAADVTEGRFAFSSIDGLGDEEAAKVLEGLLGVGRWTAAVYLLFCDGRRDLWPRGDVALLAAHGLAGGPFGRGDIRAFDQWANETYAPHRGIAAHILWSRIALERGREPV